MENKIKALTSHKILIYGDVMIDNYIKGTVKRISPEAPVPVVRVTETFSVLGGAANVARNLIGLKCKPTIIGVRGHDMNGDLMEALFEKKGISHHLFEVDSPTITKARLIGNNQQIARIDFEDEKIILSRKNELQIINALKESIPDADIIVISDYGKGSCTFGICQFIITHAQACHKKVVVDPKGISWKKYQGAFMVTPNVKELSDIYGAEIINSSEAINPVGERVKKDFHLTNLLVTRSEKGMSLIDENDECLEFSTKAESVYDVSGAGDTVVATIAASLCGGLPLVEGINIANMAASVVISKMGTQPIEINELITKVNIHDKVITREMVPSLIKYLRDNHKKIVFTNGCFDILHRGHVEYLSKAKEKGDILIVGLNSDSSIRTLKGPTRPVNQLEDRIYVLQGLSSIDYIIVFDDETPSKLIKEIQPDILAKGADYKIEEVVGREYAGDVELIPLVEGRSTTSIINRMK